MSDQILTASNSSGNVNKSVHQSAKTVEILATLSSGAIHELKNDLAAIILCVENSLRDIRRKANFADFFLDMLQTQIKSVIAVGDANRDAFKICSIKNNINAVLDQYPFQNNERNLITVKINTDTDFEYNGNFILTNHILFNFIRNSLRAIINAGKGEIMIELEYGKKFNKLIFKDTATGIPKEFLSEMFELFKSKQNSSGIGLALCRQIMSFYNGEITCESIESEYTVFTLAFPNVQ